MKFIYLSHSYNKNTPSYGGEINAIDIIKIKNISNGDTTNNTKIVMNCHLGTHIDFPKHFSNNGKNLSNYNPSFWVFNKIGFVNCKIEKLVESLNLLDNGIEILIVKTGFEKYREHQDYLFKQPIIHANLATILRNKFPNLRAFGFDMLSLTSQLDKNEGKKAHIEFLINNDIIIIEDMRLAEISTTPELMIVAPLLISEADGVPCTIFAKIK